MTPGVDAGKKREKRKGGSENERPVAAPTNSTAGVKPDQMFFFILFQSYLR